jgi:hypothetical protein
MTTATKQKQFAVSRVAFTKREAERILRRMKHFGVFHLRIIGSRGCWFVAGLLLRNFADMWLRKRSERRRPRKRKVASDERRR